MEVQVTNDGGVYQIKLIAEVDASAEYVYRLLTDYNHIYRFTAVPLTFRRHAGNGAAVIRYPASH